MSGLIEKIKIYGISVLGGNEKLFGEIWELYSRKVLFFIKEITGRGADAEDLFQEVMLKVYENLDGYNPGYALSTWIYTIARNHCYDYLRKKRNLVEIFDDEAEFPDRKKTPEDSAVLRDMDEHIGEFISRLKEADREIVYFRFYEEMKYGEIAKVTGIPEGTVKAKVSDIRKKLSDYLEGKNENR